MSSSVGEEDYAVHWPDGRYTLFVATLSLLLTIGIGIPIVFSPLPNFLPVAFLACLFFILQPKTPPDLKGPILRLILGDQAPIAINYNYTVAHEKHIIEISDRSGTTSIFRRRRIHTHSSDSYLSATPHDYSFSEGAIKNIYETDNGSSPIKCEDENGITLVPDVIIENSNYFEFLLPFSAPIGIGDEYGYTMEMGKVETAFPIEDGDDIDSWTVKYYVPVDHVEIEIHYKCDLEDTTIHGQKLKNTKTEETIALSDTDQDTKIISVSARDLNPGNYVFSWEKR